MPLAAIALVLVARAAACKPPRFLGHVNNAVKERIVRRGARHGTITALQWLRANLAGEMAPGHHDHSGLACQPDGAAG